MAELTYKRILLKVSGEALMGGLGHGIDMNEVSRIAEEVAEARALGAEISIVIGGGNIFRGVAGAAKGMDRGEADYMGMLATVMNAIALQGGLRRAGLDARAMSAGVSRATIPTMAGMVAALSGLIFSNQIERLSKQRVARLADQLELE